MSAIDNAAAITQAPTRCETNANIIRLTLKKILVLLEQRALEKQDERGTAEHHEQRREDEQHDGEGELHRGARGGFSDFLREREGPGRRWCRSVRSARASQPRIAARGSRCAGRGFAGPA